MWKLFAALIMLPLAAMAQTEVTLSASDGTTIYTDFFTHGGSEFRGTVLLFHQADSNAAEYADIAPRLNDLGFDAIAIDQRSGGSMFGGTNRTVAALGHSTPYEAALPDLEGALNYATGLTPGGPVIVWGSSYSAALVLVLAARQSAQINAVLAFSPGEYLPTIKVAQEAASLTMPVYLTASGTDVEMAEVTAIAAAMTPDLTTIHDPKAGRHGSSTLRAASNPGGWQDNWVPVEEFLRQVAP